MTGLYIIQIKQLLTNKFVQQMQLEHFYPEITP